MGLRGFFWCIGAVYFLPVAAFWGFRYRHSVVRLMPSRLAAAVWLPPTAARVRWMAFMTISSRVPEAASAGRAGAGGSRIWGLRSPGRPSPPPVPEDLFPYAKWRDLPRAEGAGEKDEAPAVPETGDDLNATAPMAVALVGAAALAGTVIARRRACR